MPYLPALTIVMEYALAVFWLSQIIRVLMTGVEDFEDHKHKLLWFLVVVFVPLIGAAWFATWRRKEAKARRSHQAQEEIERIAERFRAENNT